MFWGPRPPFIKALNLVLKTALCCRSAEMPERQTGFQALALCSPGQFLDSWEKLEGQELAVLGLSADAGIDSYSAIQQLRLLGKLGKSLLLLLLQRRDTEMVLSWVARMWEVNCVLCGWGKCRVCGRC